jgi:hypothetical protein
MTFERYLAIAVLGVAVSWSSLPAARADNVDMSKIVCSNLVSADADTISHIIFWIDGYMSGMDKTTVTDLGGLGKATELVLNSCKKTPKKTVFDVIKSLG